MPRRAAVAVVPLTAATVLAGCLTLLRAPSAADLAILVVATAMGAAATAIGLVVARRAPDNPVALLLTLMGLVPCLVTVLDIYAAASVSRPGLLPAGDLAVVLDQGVWVWWYVPVGLLVLRYPDGRLPGRRWRWVAVALPLDAAAIHLLSALDPAPYTEPFAAVARPLGTLPPAATSAAYVLMPGLLALLGACVASLVIRLRRARGRQRAQFKWLALAGISVPATLLACWAGYLLLGRPEALVGPGLVLIYLAVPVAAAIGLLRTDRYDVDRAVSATATYGLASAGLLAIFTVVSFLGGLALGSGSTLTAAGATAVCAAAVAPLRTRVQRRVDRRLYATRRAARAAIDGLRHDVHAGRARPEQLEGALRVALRDLTLRVGYRLPGSEGLVDVDGRPIVGYAQPDAIAVMLGGQRIGALVHASATSRGLLREVAQASALLVEVVRLRVELAGALREVESSRARLVHLGYQERRRLERDLHDGAQQRLVALGMALRLAQRHLANGSVDVDGVLDQAVAELGTAVAELRQIAHGIRPSSLDDGLGAALQAMVSAVPAPVDLVVSADGLPDDIVTTAYYVASEAVTNAIRYAQAGQIGLTVTQHDGEVRIRVRDDGCGGAKRRPGSGLSGLADRVAALGGSFQVDSGPGRGTVVEAVLPCAS